MEVIGRYVAGEPAPSDSPVLLLRADGGARCGMGHVMRSFALAEEWVELGGRALLLCHGVAQSLLARMGAQQVETVSLPAQYPDSRDLAIVEALQGASEVGWIALDGYHFDLQYQQRVARSGWQRLIIDDYGHLPRYEGEAILCQNVLVALPQYPKSIVTTHLLGPRYALLRREFSGASHSERSVRREVRHILISMGGADPFGLTSQVLPVVDDIADDGCVVRVIVGPANPHLALVQSSAEECRRVHIEICSDVTDMSAMMRWADLAVSAAGTTALELAATGLPAVLILVVDNQVGLGATLARLGAAQVIDARKGLSVEMLGRAIGALIDDFTTRVQMSRAGVSAVDGRGASRVVEVLWRMVRHGPHLSTSSEALETGGSTC